ncbi:MAG TPA: hypothetical protein VFE58_07540 [Tepidisphaeraceae bacterium]|jgi:hypothetical protein|nr:hypothetical protein [Tepidisphaeraceae bacterium]
MFLPSARNWEEMRNEVAGCWPLPIDSGDEFAFVVKMQTSVIKAAYRKCPVSLTVAKANTEIGTVIATSLKFDDDPQSPLMLTGALRHNEEQVAIQSILRAGQTLMFFFDELSRPIARASCTLIASSAQAASDMLAVPGKRYSGAWSPLLSEVLDELQGIEDPQLASNPKHGVHVVKIGLTLSNFETIQLTTIGVDDVINFKLDDPDEGHGLEQSTWHLLENLFSVNLFHSPVVKEGEVSRELTDIFSLCSFGQCLFETKNSAILTTSLNRTTERRAKTVKKQIDKGIDQLVGAIKNLDAGLPLFTKKGQPLEIPLVSASSRHGIVMISEMLPSLDWEKIGSQLLAASKKTGAMLHVLDLRELRVLVGISRDMPEMLLEYLTYRFKVMSERKHAMLRMRLEDQLPP